MITLLGLDPATYVPSGLHSPERSFRETNCYVDLWIELLHARGIDPASALAFTCSTDFEGDQWTFFKPPPEDLMQLYGIDVHEMQLYRPTVDHVVEQLRAGRTITIEVDSFYLPDRAGIAYHIAHVKSSIAIEAVDPQGESLRYFHGPGYYELSGEDFRGVFRLGRVFSEDVLPPYTEIVRFDAAAPPEKDELRENARETLRRSLARRPERNPWLAFGERLSKDLPGLLAESEAGYHAFAFATLRQCGAAFELCCSFLDWLGGPGSVEFRVASEAFGRQVSGAKALLLKLARRRVFDPSAAISQLASDWQTAMSSLVHLSSGALAAV